MTSQATSPHSSLLLSHGAQKWPNLETLKNHRQLTKIATSDNLFAMVIKETNRFNIQVKKIGGGG